MKVRFVEDRLYMCIDLKSFYASVECVERGLDPFKTDLVVADPARSKGTICLAITPAMKAKGVKNRCRVYEIPLGMKYITAPPRMQLYIDYSTRIYGIYLEFFAEEDIYVYSIDEVFIDIRPYLRYYGKTARQLGQLVISRIYEVTGIRATCGIGTNLYLAKIALDIVAKHASDFIGFLDEESYRQKLWTHEPLTDFWNVGPGITRRMNRHGLYNMKDIALCDENIIYEEMGINGELLIDHAWGKESVTMADIKSFKPKSKSLSSGQILMRDYKFAEGMVIVKEMADLLCLKLTKGKKATKFISLLISYSHNYETAPAHGSVSLNYGISSASRIVPLLAKLYERITDRNLPIRRVDISLELCDQKLDRQLSIFEDPEDHIKEEKQERIQNAINYIKDRYGKNSILKAMNYLDGATTRERNGQIGGHRSGN